MHWPSQKGFMTLHTSIKKSSIYINFTCPLALKVIRTLWAADQQTDFNGRLLNLPPPHLYNKGKPEKVHVTLKWPCDTLGDEFYGGFLSVRPHLLGHNVVITCAQGPVCHEWISSWGPQRGLEFQERGLCFQPLYGNIYWPLQQVWSRSWL